jgi:hypothetical protein
MTEDFEVLKFFEIYNLQAFRILKNPVHKIISKPWSSKKLSIVMFQLFLRFENFKLFKFSAILKIVILSKIFDF